MRAQFEHSARVAHQLAGLHFPAAGPHTACLVLLAPCRLAASHFHSGQGQHVGTIKSFFLLLSLVNVCGQSICMSAFVACTCTCSYTWPLRAAAAAASASWLLLIHAQFPCPPSSSSSPLCVCAAFATSLTASTRFILVLQAVASPCSCLRLVVIVDCAAVWHA